MKTAFLKACSRLGMFRIARALTGSGIRILAYHGFCAGDEADFQPMLFMRGTTFRSRMKCLIESGHRVVPLSEAVQRLRHDDVEPGLAVITIDDGWHGIHEHAWPVLREFGLPATVYVSSYYARAQLPVINVLARYLVWKSPLSRVRLDGPGSGLSSIHELPDQRARDTLAAKVAEHAEHALPRAGRLPFLEQFAAALEVDLASVLARRTFHLMSPAQLRELASGGVDLQLHTHRHRFPPDDPDACREEIEENRAFLQEIGSGPIEHFCYPSGRYRAEQKAWLRDLGVVSATTTRDGLCYPGTDPMELPRFLDSEVFAPELFEAAVAGLLATLREPARTLRRSLAA